MEGRLASGSFARLKANDLVTFTCGSRECTVRVAETVTYSSFKEMLEEETLEAVLPGVRSLAEGVKVYRRFYTKQQEQQSGVLAIKEGADADCSRRSFTVGLCRR